MYMYFMKNINISYGTGKVGMTRTLHMHNTLQIPKYLKTGNFMKFLSVKIRISSKLSIYWDQDHSSKQLYMPEPDV